jgi:hypothetical protein
MVSEPFGAGSGESVAAGLADLLAAAGVLVVGSDVADAGMQASAVVVGPHDLQLGARLKTVRSHLSDNDLARLAANGGRPAGPPPLPRPDSGGAAVEVDRVVSTAGTVSLLGRPILAPEILAGRRITVRIDDTTLTFFDPDTRELLRTRPSPFTYTEASRLLGGRPAGPPPRPSLEPVRVQRRASNTGVIMVAGQKVALGHVHAHTTVTVYVAETTLTIEAGDDRTVARTTTTPVRYVKASRPRKAAL